VDEYFRTKFLQCQGQIGRLLNRQGAEDAEKSKYRGIAIDKTADEMTTIASISSADFANR
jgi:hypothetical protein